MLTVDIRRECGSAASPADASLLQWAKAAYAADAPGEVSMLIVDRKKMQALNAQYRQRDTATNVLSFPAQLDAVDGIRHLGDIVFCAPLIAEEAESQNKVNDHHWAHLTVHGMLHLQGYDHIEEQDASEMESLEISLLASMAIPNPYTHCERST